MTDRRGFLRGAALTAGGVFLAPWLQSALGAEPTRAPKRFIFLHKGNGQFPQMLVPPTLTAEQKAKESAKEAFTADLTKNDLPEWMSALNDHKKDMTILQGLSGMMCTTGHHTWQSSLGVYKAGPRLSSVKWATVDFELARLNPSPVEHIELACFPIGGGNARGNIEGIDTGFSARGPQQPNLAYGSPKVAMRELFKAVSTNKQDQINRELERGILEFTAGGQSGIARDLKGLEKLKVGNYAESLEQIRVQNGKIEAMGDVLRKHIPQLSPRHFAEDITTVERQEGHTEILLSLLISGMTNTVTFTLDELGTMYTGLKGIEKEHVNLHDVGHNKPVEGLKAEDVRLLVQREHMKRINYIVNRLKSVPEGDGNMFDNTMIFYFPDNGETHHSTGVEWPFVVLAGRNSKLNISGKYIRLPKHGVEGHKTLGNWYTTILNTYGNPIPHFGDLDLDLEAKKLDQKGSIKQFTT